MLNIVRQWSVTGMPDIKDDSQSFSAIVEDSDEGILVRVQGFCSGMRSEGCLVSLHVKDEKRIWCFDRGGVLGFLCVRLQ